MVNIKPLKYFASLLSYLLIVCLLIGYTHNCHSRNKIESNTQKRLLSNIDSLRIAKFSLGSFKVTPFFLPSYSPETKAMLRGGGLITYSTQKNNVKLERSSLSIATGYSTNNSLFTNINSTIYTYEDRYRFETEFWLKNMPDHYWGVGYSNGMYVEISDSTTSYYKKWMHLNHKTSFRFKNDLFLGFLISLSSTDATDLNDRMAVDKNILEFGSHINNFGIGASLQYDTRDFIQNPYQGVFIEFSYIHFDNILFGTSKFNNFKLDYRHFFTLKRKRQTLAIKYQTNISIGDIPWSELNQLGSPNDIRGYYWGQFRDKTTMFGLAEYRHMFKRFKPSKSGSFDSQFGYVLWLGTGSLGNKLEDFKQWLPNYGIGLRFEIQPRLNVRLDYGFGKNSKGLYFTFMESF